MKVVLLNNDLRVYWKGRLVYLRNFLGSKKINLYAIELFGKGSPYSFDDYDNEEKWWTCMFPQNSAGELSKEDIRKGVFSTLDKINPDVVIASSIVFFAGALGIRWAKKNKKKFIMFDDAKPSQFKRNFLVQGVKNIITKQSDFLWLPSNEYDNEYTELLNGKVPFFYGYDCVNNDLFKVSSKRVFNNNRIICVGRLVPIKNIDKLLRAWQQIELKGIDWKLSIIGKGPDYETLINLSAFLKLQNVEFLGTVNNNDIPAHFYNSDVFILPSLSETWGLVVNEAMAAGLPVLLSNKVNAAHTLLHDGVNGFSFDPCDEDSMAETILKYISLDFVHKKNMSAKSLSIISEMSYEKMGIQLEEALTQVMLSTFKSPGLIANVILNLWGGRYNTSAWDKL